MCARRTGGYTLVELLIVVSLLALVAAVAAPALQDSDEADLHRSTTELVRAIRFAHSEAIRSGRSHGVVARQLDQSVQVYRIDETVGPPVVRFDVYDPQTKQPYALRFGTGLLDADIADVYFKFVSASSAVESLEFGATTGVPRYEDSGKYRMLEDGYITLQKNDLKARIAVAPMTGRVTIQ